MNTSTLVLNIALMALVSIVVAAGMCLPLFLDRDLPAREAVGGRASRSARTPMTERRLSDWRSAPSEAHGRAAGANQRI
jgi:hypothetical protein